MPCRRSDVMKFKVEIARATWREQDYWSHGLEVVRNAVLFPLARVRPQILRPCCAHAFRAHLYALP